MRCLGIKIINIFPFNLLIFFPNGVILCKIEMNDTDKKSGKGEENCEGVTFERMVEKENLWNLWYFREKKKINGISINVEAVMAF